MRLLRALALFAALVAPMPASAQLWLWSQTPTTNGNIDPSINWAEGMPPSAVNDSSRAEMAVIAKWRDDANGLVTLGGTLTAYTATTNQGNQSGGVSSLTPGYRLCFSPNVVNGASPTLAVDGQAAKPLHSGPATNLAGGELKIGTPYCATYFSSNGGEYILNEFYTTLISPGSIGTTQLANGAVTYAKIQNETNQTILGNDSGGSAPPQELTLGQGLGFSGTSVLVPNLAITSGLIANGAIGTSQLATSGVTYSKIQNESASTLLGNPTGSPAAPSEITLTSTLTFSGTTVGVANAGIGTTQLANSSVTYAKIQNESNATILGNDSGGAAAPGEITLGTGLQFSSATVIDTNLFTPDIQTFTSGSSLTYTTATKGGKRPLYLRVRIVGGGGGGGAQNTNSGNPGGDTSFASWTAIHGAGGTNGGNGGAGGSGGASSTGTLVARISGAQGDAGNGAGGGNPAGGIGGSSVLGGAGAGTLNGAGGAASANSGSGGGGGSTSAGNSSGGGGAGEFVEFIITSPAASYTYTVGSGGSGGAAGGTAGGNGGAGIIIVEGLWQ